MTTTYESVNVTWPIACAFVPSPSPGNTFKNSRSSATPITISGVTSGRSIIVFTVPEPRPRQRCRPRASVTPSGTEITTVIAASSSVCWSALCRAGSWKTLPVDPVNQRNENPCHVVRERPALNANRIASPTGTIDQTMYSPVTRTRARGLPQGLRSQAIMLRPPSRPRRASSGGSRPSARATRARAGSSALRP